ncbi:hypothetical protein C2W58_03621 [Bacillus pumilus]|uniref:Uncharacterized protein n=1 Tax=Bacillus pumilus TaxID=1408 RepID=A0AB34QSU4_BACPU|nr:hypothetical protein B4127_0704 [Bacillus pumilus]RAP11970.1 hypothetical protein C2W58_03621 [Bacillus pumilus]
MIKIDRLFHRKPSFTAFSFILSECFLAEGNVAGDLSD